MMRKASKFTPVGKSMPVNISDVYVNHKNTVFLRCSVWCLLPCSPKKLSFVLAQWYSAKTLSSRL